MWLTVVRLITALVFCCLTLGSLPWPALADVGDRSIVTFVDKDFFGFDLRTIKDVTQGDCSAACIADRDCAALTYNPKVRWCFLKSDYRDLNDAPGAIAGKILVAEQAAEDDLGAAPLLSFVTPDITSQADQYLKAILRVGTEGINSASHALALADVELSNGDPRRAIDTLKKGIALSPQNHLLWARLAETIKTAAASNDQEQSQFQQDAISASLYAYNTSRNLAVRAQSLADFAGSLAIRDYNKVALAAYQASLELVSSPTVRADYLDLKAREGFRVLDADVQHDASTARICAQFSSSLAKSGVDYLIYVRLDNQAPQSVTAKEQQLCVEGLDHGRTYNLTLREGLPSGDGEQLAAPANFNLYVKDRPASVRFTGDSFVLPAKGRHGIPLVSVNLQSASLKLFRISDRAIAHMLSGAIFRRQLDDYDLSQVSDQLGAPVWQGAIELAGAELNKEAVTSIPIDEAIGERKAGVYVLTAQTSSDEEQRYEAKATQWFVISDIGLSTYTGQDGISVFARSLSTAKPLANINLTLLAKNNDILAEAASDDYGQVVFSPDVTAKSAGAAPAAIIAKTSNDEDFVFLDLTTGGFDLSDRGVTGRDAPKTLDVFAWTERGIYRPGETVHLSALARDASVAAVDKLPLTFIFNRPDGVEDRRVVSTSEALGGYHISYDLTNNAMRGTWNVQVYTDPKLPAIASQMFLVEDFVPDRLEFDLTAAAQEIAIGRDIAISVDGRYLYGAPAAGLSLEGDLVLKSERLWERFAGYYFGLAEEEDGDSFRVAMPELPVLDANGKATFPLTVQQVPSTTRLVKASLSTRLQETGGRAVERKLDLLVQPPGDLLGIKPEFSGNEVGQGSPANFSVIAVSNRGERRSVSDVKWTLEKIERNYQWYREGNRWTYDAVNFTRVVETGTVNLTESQEAKISVPTDWGRYRLVLASDEPDGPTSSYEFNSGWFVSANSTETPEGLDIALDKEVYAVGDTASLKISPSFAGELLIAIGAERLYETIHASVPEGGTTIEIPVKSEWGAGTYVTATLFRPGEQVESKMPSRAIGLKWLKVDPAEKTLEITLDAPAKIEPNSRLSVPVQVSRAAGQDAYVTLAVVDVGILNLTRYQPPKPSDWFFGQRKLSLELRDLYGRMIDGSLGVTGALRTGGDGANMATEGSPPTEKLLALFSGPIALDRDGKAVIEFDIPQFNGTARLMAVAWSASSIGQANTDVIIRDPIVVSANLPRFLTPGDVADVSIDIAATDVPTGDYRLSIEASSHFTIAPEESDRSFSLSQGARLTLPVSLTAETIGEGYLVLRVGNGADVALEQTLGLKVLPVDQPVTTRQSFTLSANGGDVSIDAQLIQQQKIDGAAVNLSVSSVPDFDIGGLLLGLDLYPYGCTEQTTSRALPLLYLTELLGASAQDSRLGTAEEFKERVQKAIYSILNNQSSNGSFGLWSASSEGGLWLDAYVSDFLTRAKEQGYEVPQAALKQSLMSLQNTLTYTTDVKDNGSEIAYALYVLARNKKASLGDLRYYASSQIEAFSSPLAVAQLGAALAYYGDQALTDRLFALAIDKLNIPHNGNNARSDYGSPLRDAAAVLTLAAEVKPASKVTPALLQIVGSIRNQTRYLSTQDQTWMVLAAKGLRSQDAAIKLEVDNEDHQGAYSKTVDGQALAGQGMHLVNVGDIPVTATMTVVSSPLHSLSAGGEGFEISREYFTLDGEPVNISSAAQNTRYVVVLKVNESNDAASNILVSDFLPAGFEIDNPGLVSSAELSNFSWIEKIDAAHLEFRNDRFVAAFNRGAGQKPPLTLAYVVRAVTPGLYSHPAALVENMYQPQFNARTSTSMLEVVK